MSDVDWDLVFRYFGDECGAEEREEFERWLNADPRRRVVVEAAAVAADRSLAELRRGSPRPRVRVATPWPASDASWRMGAAAAALLLLAGTGVLWIERSGTSATAEREAAPLRMARTTRGERRTFDLSDGTRVVLGATSTLRYPAAFGAGAREVSLTGEGYFDVKHDSAHPFRVHAGHATAEDVGTQFGVLAYAGDSVVRVVVREGSVSLGATTGPASPGALVVRGQLGTLARGRVLASVHTVNVDAYLGWTEGRLVFDETPLSEALTQLGRWYGVPFRVADSALLSRRLTASFTTQSLPDVLTALAPVLDVRFESVSGAVLMHSR